MPFIGLYNEAGQQGFSSTVKEDSAPATGENSGIDAELAEIEAKATEIQGSLGQRYDSGRYECLIRRVYRLWDDELNSIWGRLKTTLPADTMEQLTDEEVAWIGEKEASMAAAGVSSKAGVRSLCRKI